MSKTKKKRGRARKLAKEQKRTEPVKTEGRSDAEKKLLAALDKAGSSGGFWSPQVVGDTILGEILSMKREKGKYQRKGETQLVLVVGNDDGAKTVYCNKPLEGGLDGIKAKVGDTVGIQLKDFVSTGKGNPARVFAVKKLDKKRHGK